MKQRGIDPSIAAQLLAVKKFNEAWNDYRKSDEGQDKLKYIKGQLPYNENVMWWIFQAGYFAAIK